MKPLDWHKPLIPADDIPADLVEISTDHRRSYPVTVSLRGADNGKDMLATYTKQGRFFTYVEKSRFDLRNAA